MVVTSQSMVFRLQDQSQLISNCPKISATLAAMYHSLQAAKET